MSKAAIAAFKAEENIKNNETLNAKLQSAKQKGYQAYQTALSCRISRR